MLENNALDLLFADDATVMWTLSSAGSFTNYGFIRHISQNNQTAYVDFLKDVRDRREGTDVFRLAHRQISVRLKSRAEALGYDIDDSAVVKEPNIWGDMQDATVYRRTVRVQQPT